MSRWYPGMFLDRFMGEKKTQREITGKEADFLKYNKDEIFKNLIAAEGHFRNVLEHRQTVESGGFNCVVKHLADSEGHADEAISHSSIVETEQNAYSFVDLRDEIRDLRWRTQTGITALEGITAVRQIRHHFESFNPEYDVTKCQSCQGIEQQMANIVAVEKEC